MHSRSRSTEVLAWFSRRPTSGMERDGAAQGSLGHHRLQREGGRRYTHCSNGAEATILLAYPGLATWCRDCVWEAIINLLYISKRN